MNLWEWFNTKFNDFIERHDDSKCESIPVVEHWDGPEPTAKDFVFIALVVLGAGLPIVLVATTM